MSYLIHPWKQLTICVCIFTTLLCCKKRHIEKAPSATQPATTSVYESFTQVNDQAYCGSVLITDLKIKDGTDIGTVEVGNDAEFLFLTYHLNDDWYFTGAQSYAGSKTAVPLTPNGNPNPSQFPGKKTVNPCDGIKSLVFKVPLSELQADASSQCYTNAQYFIAMRASVKQISNNSGCATGAVVEAWAAPVLINPGDASEWATAFYYCRQECNQPASHTQPPASEWCGFGQGYWFAKPNVMWCRDFVEYGNLTVGKSEARNLWPAQNNIIKKAFFQASALQLSMVCNNNNLAIPQAIAGDYNTIVTFLSGLNYSDIEKGNLPAGADAQAIQTAAGNIGKWICQNNCNASIDPTDCQ